MIELVAGAPSFFRGEKTGEVILFAPNRLPLWFRYFDNDNILYRINNTLGAEALSRALPDRAADVLEIGGGCGSGGSSLMLAREFGCSVVAAESDSTCAEIVSVSVAASTTSRPLPRSLEST